MDYKFLLVFALTGFFSGSGVLAMNKSCVNQNQMSKFDVKDKFLFDLAKLEKSVTQTINRQSTFSQESPQVVSDFLAKSRELVVQVDNSAQTYVDLFLKTTTFSDVDTLQQLAEAWNTIQTMGVNLAAHVGSIRQHILGEMVRFSFDVQNLYDDVLVAIKKQSNDINNFKKKPNVFLNLTPFFSEIGSLAKRLEQLENTGIGLLDYNKTRMLSDIIFALESDAVKIKNLRSGINTHMSQIESLDIYQYEFNQLPAPNEKLQRDMFRYLDEREKIKKAIASKMDLDDEN